MAWMDDVGREGVDGWMDGWCGMGWLFWRCLEVRIERGDRGGGRGVVDGREGEEERERGKKQNLDKKSFVEFQDRAGYEYEYSAVRCGAFPIHTGISKKQQQKNNKKRNV